MQSHEKPVKIDFQNEEKEDSWLDVLAPIFFIAGFFVLLAYIGLKQQEAHKAFSDMVSATPDGDLASLLDRPSITHTGREFIKNEMFKRLWERSVVSQ